MSLPAIPNAVGNRLLDRLPKNEYKPLVRSAKAVSLAHGDEVYQEDGLGGLSHVYFPTSGMISLTVLMEDGKEVEAGTIGNEGMIGLSVAHGLDFSPTKAISQISGEGLRIPVAAFLKAMKQGGVSRDGITKALTNATYTGPEGVYRFTPSDHAGLGPDSIMVEHVVNCKLKVLPGQNLGG